MRESSIAFMLAAVVATAGLPVQAAPVEYVRVCSAFGTGYFYIPGTDTCVNVNTGETRRNTVDGVVTGVTQQQQQILDNAEQIKRNTEGVAMGFALPKATVDPGKSFGAAFNIGAFDGAVAVGVGGAFRAGEGVTFNGALGYGLGEGTLGGNAGVNVSW
jgi:hypothetical protein